MFDVATIGGAEALLALDPAAASAWRDAGGQAFAGYEELELTSIELYVALVLELFRIEVASPPRTVEKTPAFLSGFLSRTLVALDNGAGGQPEGVVVRTLDRSVVAKLQFEDYRRTLKRARSG